VTYLALACRAMLLGVFLCSCVSKVRGREPFDSFVESVARLGVIPRSWSRRAAAATVAAEASTVVLLALPDSQLAGFAVALGLLACFTGVVAPAIRGGFADGCRCFGAPAASLGTPHVVRNLVLVAAGLAGAAATAVPASGPVDPGGVVVALIAAAFVVVLVVRLDDVLGAFA
jgi:hypothetical protein